MGRCLPLVRFARYPTVILSISTSIFYGFHRKKTPLLNDAGSDTNWPRLKAVATGKREEQSLKENHGSATTITPIAIIPSDAPVADPEAEENTPSFEDDDGSAWDAFSSRVHLATSAITAVPWSRLGNAITDFILPDWAKVLPAYAAKLQRELEMAQGSLADDIWQEAQDTDMHPEISSIATVRIGKDLCLEEQVFKERRKKFTTRALARYLDIPEDDIHPDDVPIMAMCGSGGGLRAMVAGCGSYLSAQEAGLFDCITYTAGVSGSCWLQTLYYSSIGNQRISMIVAHLKNRIGTHIAFPPAALELLTSAPTNKFLLSGFVEKLKSDPNADFGLVEIYGLLLAARLLIPHGELGVDDRDLKISNQRSYLTNGEHPLPIYTAVRHEIPLKEQESDEESAKGNASIATQKRAKQEAWFQWFEFTPYEVFCEELNSGIPTWGLGRRYQNGKSISHENGLHLPEFRVPLLMGIWGSAFCATLGHYYKEIRPVVNGLPGFGGLDSLIEDQNDELTKLHPFEPASIPNYALGLRDKLPPTCPESIFRLKHLQLADAGMSNNLPIYPLLREGRDVDILIAFDSSADIKQENWLSVADGYARQRGIKGWPIGVGWPKEDASKEDTSREIDAAEARSAQEAAGKIAEVRERQRRSDNATEDSLDQGNSNLSYCNVWVGTTVERISESEPPHSKLINPDADWELLSPDAGITVVYFPLLPNPKVDGIDPNTTEFLSTWNFVYSRDEIDKLISLTRANFDEGKAQTKRTIRAVYERKKTKRTQQEKQKSLRKWNLNFKQHGNQFQ